jgi:hypothetical protein
VVAAIAARSGADVAVEIGWPSEFEGGPEHGRVLPTEVGDGVEFGAAVQHSLEEGIPPEFLGQ